MPKILTFTDGVIKAQEGIADVTTDKVRVYRSAAYTAPSGWSIIPMDTVVFDTNNLWDSANAVVRPKKAGYYLVSVRVRVTGTTTTVETAVHTSSGSKEVGGYGMSKYASGGSCTVYCNGTTDTIRLHVYLADSRSLYVVNNESNFIDVIGPI